MAKKEKEVKPKNKKQKGHYFKDMKAELKKVIWPTPKQLASNTMAVIVFTLILAAIVLVLDLCFDAVSKYGITAAQEKLQSSYSNSAEESGENTNSDAENSAEGSNEDNQTGSEENNDGQEVEIKKDDSKSQE